MSHGKKLSCHHITVGLESKIVKPFKGWHRVHLNLTGKMCIQFGIVKTIMFCIFRRQVANKVFKMKTVCRNLFDAKLNLFLRCWFSHLDLWHNVCNKPATLLFVQKMFCNVSYFHFCRHKEKFMWGSYFTFIFPFPRASLTPTDKTHSRPPLIYCWKKSNIISKDGALSGHLSTSPNDQCE